MTGSHPNDEIDHIDRDRMNNRWSNLRQATTHQNAWNVSERAGQFPTGVQKAGSGFAARIIHKGKLLYLGCFRTVEEAAAARRQKEAELRGAFLEAVE